MHRTLLTLTILLTCALRCSLASERGFEFSGMVVTLGPTNEGDAPFGLPIESDSPVIGRFIYDNVSPITHTTLCDDCAGYRQQHLNGFWAEFGGIRVQADEYLIEIANDVESATSEMINDIVTIRFSSRFLTPALESPLFVNGVLATAGDFIISLVASSELYSDTSLPADLNPADFELGTATNFLIDPEFDSAVFMLNTLEHVTILSSDHDLDDDVDGRDFLIWQRNFGQTGQNGDANSDYQVDDLDLVTWQSQYGSIALTAQLVVVPEPPVGVVLSGLLLLVWGFAMPRKRHWLAKLSLSPNRLETPQSISARRS